jgi:hypothetical protein
MSKGYTVSQCPQSKLWYAHMVGYSYIPVMGSFSDSKREAQKHAKLRNDPTAIIKFKEKEAFNYE